jgi:very-short-patch-repair endonuclease
MHLPYTVVWEAHVVPDHGPFDMWLYGMSVLIEVDGQQHDAYMCHTTDAAEQAQRDRAKELVAVALGFHVVRLHYRDILMWGSTVEGALLEAVAGSARRVHYSPSYPTLYVFAGV